MWQQSEIISIVANNRKLLALLQQFKTIGHVAKTICRSNNIKYLDKVLYFGLAL